jgi:hypothetical protein
MRVRILDETLSLNLADEAVLLSLTTEQYYALNPVGARLWQLLKEHQDTEKALAVMLTEYSIDEATLRRDVSALLEKMVGAGLICLEDPPGA